MVLGMAGAGRSSVTMRLFLATAGKGRMRFTQQALTSTAQRPSELRPIVHEPFVVPRLVAELIPGEEAMVWGDALSSILHQLFEAHTLHLLYRMEEGKALDAVRVAEHRQPGDPLGRRGASGRPEVLAVV